MKTVLIHYFNPHNLDTARLFVKTIRVGFPTWDIHVFFKTRDDEFHEKCKAIGLDTHYKENAEHHADWIHNMLTNCVRDAETAVFCDPDMIFYEDMEHLAIQSDYPTIVGRYCPQYVNEVYKAIEYPRLHTSLLFVNQPREICAALDKRGPVQLIANENPWAQHLINLNGKKYFFDTGCCVYQQLANQRQSSIFADSELDKFTHIHSGTMSPIVASYLKKREGFELVHKLALENPGSLRGLWREQDLYYKQNQNYADVTP